MGLVRVNIQYSFSLESISDLELTQLFSMCVKPKQCANRGCNLICVITLFIASLKKYMGQLWDIQIQMRVAITWKLKCRFSEIKKKKTINNPQHLLTSCKQDCSFLFTSMTRWGHCFSNSVSLSVHVLMCTVRKSVAALRVHSLVGVVVSRVLPILSSLSDKYAAVMMYMRGKSIVCGSGRLCALMYVCQACTVHAPL